MRILIFVFFTVFSIPNEINQLNERIRQKVEKLPISRALNSQYEIYCIPSIREVYLNNEFNPFWTNEYQVNDLISILKQCQDEGLKPENYHLPEIMEVRIENSEESRANLDIILTDAFLLYISHILSGKTNPETIDSEWHVLKTNKNPVKYLYALNERSISEVIDEIKPKNKNYEALQAQLKYYRALENEDGLEEIPTGQLIKPGMTDYRIPMIREALSFSKDLPTEQLSANNTYDDSLKMGILRYQKRHGLEALGNIGNQTIEMLNISPAERIKTIIVNLERLRWLPQEVPDYYMMVNIVNFELDVVENNFITQNHKVIVGKEYRKTPVFSSALQYLVFNPTWTIPPTILKNDVIPEVRKNPSYLAQKNIFVYNKQGVKLNVDSIDWTSSDVYSFTYRQEPGKTNALGTVKFMFPNNFNVYLHDTPAKELFEKTERAFSSGCIRVHKPLELAEYLLRGQSGYSLSEIKRIVETSKTKTVILNRKPEVYLIYLTTWINDSGQLNFRKDIYNRDERVYNALQDNPVYDLQ